jgi:hypothetical protein
MHRWILLNFGYVGEILISKNLTEAIREKILDAKVMTEYVRVYVKFLKMTFIKKIY